MCVVVFVIVSFDVLVCCYVLVVVRCSLLVVGCLSCVGRNCFGVLTVLLFVVVCRCVLFVVCVVVLSRVRGSLLLVPCFLCVVVHCSFVFVVVH